jgi:hypothetical protein
MNPSPREELSGYDSIMARVDCSSPRQGTDQWYGGASRMARHFLAGIPGSTSSFTSPPRRYSPLVRKNRRLVVV